jgi:SAM-dependent methyltransferase/pyruvate-formate lyase-activating enzyme
VATPLRSVSQVEGDCARATREGLGGVLLAGGEPTLRRDLPELLALARAFGLRAGVATNGRMLSYSRVRRRVLDSRPVYLRFEVHAPSASLHDALVGVAGAFAQTWQALSSSLLDGEPDLLVEASCTVTAPALPRLPELAERLAALSRRSRLQLRLAAPLAGLDEREWPAARDAAAAVGAALALSRPLGLPMAWEGFAPCLLPGNGEALDESLRRDAPVLGPPDASAAFLHESAEDRRTPPACEQCQRGESCPGAPATALEREGEGVLRPWQGPRANSFVMVQERELPGFAIRSEGCSAAEQVPPPSPARHVFYVEAGVVSLFRTDTVDFREGRLLETKALEQLYLDLAPQGTLTEFRTDVRRTRRHPACGGCSRRDRCCQAVVAEAGLPFAAQEAWLRDRLGTLRGRVLDVGAGENLYREVLAPLARSGLLSYEALDPDPDALARLESLGWTARTWPTRVEDARLDAGGYDAVLALRSPNHFVDASRALGVICAALRPGGRLILCDSLVLGLLRKPHQAERADAVGAGHHHYRNWSSQRLLAELVAYPVELEAHVPVTAASSDLWLLELRRTGGAPPSAS